MKRSGLTFLFLTLAPPLLSQYAGPAILSRGEAPAAMSAPLIKFSPYVSMGASYDTGLLGVSVDQNGKLLSTSSWGASLAWGVSGVHSWKRTKVSLSYGGSTSLYSKASSFDYITQTFGLGVTHQLTRHIALALRESAGIVSRDFGMRGLQQTLTFDPATTYTPTSNFFDNRTIYASSQGDVIIQKSQRLSFMMGGAEYLTRYRSKALYGATGTGATGDVQYRLTRRITIGTLYNFNHITFSQIIGDTNYHSAGLSFGFRMSRFWEFSGYGGFLRGEAKSIQSVPVDPVIAALLGVGASNQITHQIFYTPSAMGRLSRTFHRGVAYATAGHLVTPGNGIFLTSAETMAQAGYAYAGFRRWSVQGGVSWVRANSLTNFTGGYGSTCGTTSVSRHLMRFVNVMSRVSLCQYSSPDFAQYNRRMADGTIGVGFSPGEVPLRLW